MFWSDKVKTVNLGLYGKLAYDVLSSIRNKVGSWYNDGFTACDVEREPDGEIVLKSSKTYYDCVKKLRRESLGPIFKKYFDVRGMNKNDCRPLYFKAELVCDAREFFCVYDLLMGHDIKTIIKTYGRELADKIAGEPVDPFVAEQEKLRREQIQEVKAALDEEKKEIRDKYEKLIGEERAAADRRAQAKIDEINKLFEQSAAVFKRASDSVEDDE